MKVFKLQALCSKLTNDSASDEEIASQVFKAVSVYLNYTGTTQCFSLGSAVTPALGDLGWDYQVSRAANFCSSLLNFASLNFTSFKLNEKFA